ncbi:MAG: response regulator transcription factor [Cyclobacteriaceae bacterium]
MKLNCVCVDDEPLALGLVEQFIGQTDFLHLVGAFDNPLEALKVLQHEQIDLIFLDIQMNDLTGIDLAKILDGKEHKPLIIFTTAFDQFAIEGYKLDAIDYLLKPFNYQEFLKAATKAQQYRQLQKGNEVQGARDYLFLKVEYQLIKVRYDDILFIEGLKDYVRVHLKEGKPILSLTSLKSLEDKLPASKFYRIHRSHIVSLDKVDAITKNSLEIGDKMLTISENYRESFHKAIGSGY